MNSVMAHLIGFHFDHKHPEPGIAPAAVILGQSRSIIAEHECARKSVIDDDASIVQDGDD